MKTKLLKVLVLIALLLPGVPLALYAQQARSTNASSRGSAAAARPQANYIAQSNTFPDGTHRVTKLIEEKLVWNNACHGYLIAARARKSDPGVISLQVPEGLKSILHESTNSALPTKVVKNLKQLPAIDFQTDITAIRAFQKYDPFALEFYGTVSMCLIPDFNTPDHKSKLYFLAGTNGTRIDLSPLFSRREQVEYLGRYWRPKKDKEAILVVTTHAIYALNLSVSEAKK